ncbi:OmpA family protein [Limnohabitans sp. DM1]|uniref:OmpA family protein n=1 Tax=Limnohabitans sp. DM1 TaxID=1597955 RepID=UPI000B7DF6D1|nr:OmpA family protein [Limnohabitans sp. DM1]
MTPKTFMKNSCFSSLYVAFRALFCIQVALMVPWSHAQSASSNNTGADGKFGGFEVGSVFKIPASVVEQQSRMIFYRPNTSDFKGAATIYFNGMYHATLPRNAYTSLCASPGVVNVGVISVMAAGQNNASLESISAIALQGGRNHYLRVVEDQGLKVLQLVSEQEALAELASSREQIHTISRVTPAQACRTALAQAQAQAAPSSPQVNAAAQVANAQVANAQVANAQDAKPAVPSVQTITLGADALFDFAGSDRKALGPQGRVALDNLIANVMSNYNSVERIHVLGYADPIGESAVNNRLAKERAQTVRDYLKENGLQTTFITSEGRGSNALVQATCGRKPTAEDIACNAPNRRVKVLISGVVR